MVNLMQGNPNLSFGPRKKQGKIDSDGEAICSASDTNCTASWQGREPSLTAKLDSLSLQIFDALVRKQVSFAFRCSFVRRICVCWPKCTRNTLQDYPMKQPHDQYFMEALLVFIRNNNDKHYEWQSGVLLTADAACRLLPAA